MPWNVVRCIVYEEPVILLDASVIIARRWKRMHRWCQEGVLIMPIIITQDEASIDGNNRRSLVPIYATLGWIRAQWRNQPWARALLGYLPTLKEEDQPKDMSDASWKAIKRNLHKAGMAQMLRPLRKTMRTGGIEQSVTYLSSKLTDASDRSEDALACKGREVARGNCGADNCHGLLRPA